MDRTDEECKLIVLPSVDSTNTYAKNNFSLLSDGTLVCAVEQFSGRGRLGRKWIAPPGTSLTGSVVFKQINQAFHAGVVVGLAGLELVRECIPDKTVFFKWPNDIYVRECKIAGILSEGIIDGGKLTGVVSGIGINVNQVPEELDIPGNPATSLSIVSGKKFFIEKLRFKLAEKVKKYYITYQFRPDAILGLWRDENLLTGENLVFNMPDGTIRQGRFDGIGENGEMQVTSPSGSHFVFDCGDVKIDTSLIDFNLLENKYNKNGRL